MNIYNRVYYNIKALTVILFISVFPFINIPGLLACIFVYLSLKTSNISLMRLANGFIALSMFIYPSIVVGLTVFGAMNGLKEKIQMVDFCTFIILAALCSLYTYLLFYYSKNIDDYIQVVTAIKDEQERVLEYQKKMNAKEVIINIDDHSPKQSIIVEKFIYDQVL